MLFTNENTTVLDRVMADGFSGEERQSYDLGPGLRCLLIFRLEREIARSSRVMEATLRVPVLGPPGQPGGLGVSNILRPWDPETVSWSSPWSKPGGAEGIDYSTVRAVPLIAPAAGSIEIVELDVTADVQRWARGRASNVGWMLHGDVRIGGRSNALMGATPTVDVKYIDGAPAAPGAGLGGL